jgi:ferredoxin--NADP+ reductase
MPVWCQGTITDRQVWTEGLFTIRVHAPEVLPFLPGQFLHLGLEINSGERPGQKKLVSRPYSVASPFGAFLEFFIVLVEDGELTPHLWQLRVEDSIQVSQKGAGSFTLEKAPAAENLWLLATGTGLAPYVAMVRDPLIWEKYSRVVIVHGVRQASELAYSGELRTLETRFPNRFHFIQTLTRDQHPDCLQGRIPRIIGDGSLEQSLGIPITAEHSTVMLCGNPAMLDSMEQLLAERQMKLHRSKSPGQIVLERYW